MKNKVKSAGVIPLRFLDTFQVYLVKHQNGSHWGFPKGHIDDQEEPKETAIRELKEETPLKIEKFLDIPPFIENYTYEFDNNFISKEVTYFAAICSPSPSNKILDDVIEGKWVDVNASIDVLTFNESKNIMKKIINYFDTHEAL